MFSSKYGKLIEYLVNPIPKNKSVKEIGPIKNCLRIIREGGTIAVFPEGNRSYDGNLCYIDESISKMAKMMRVDLVIYNIHGGYGIDPRWCSKARRGKSYGCVKRIISKEEIANYTVEELFNIIKEELTVPFEENVRYKGKNYAYGLERVLYICPICGKVQTLESHRDNIECSYCGLKVKYNEYLNFESNNTDFKFKTVADWYKYQIEYLKKFDINIKDVIYTDDANLFVVPFKEKSKLLLAGKLEMFNDRIVFFNEKENKEFGLDEIKSMTVLGKHKLNFYIGDNVYQIKGDASFNALKYMQMYYHIINVKGGEADEFFGM